MAVIDQHQQADGTYYLATTDLLVETDVEQIVAILKAIYHHDQATYAILDLTGNYVLPMRVLASRIRHFFRGMMRTSAPFFVAVIVEPDILQVMDTVLKTLVSRDAIQPFTDIDRARQWLKLERLKQQKVENIGAIMRKENNPEMI